jgi:hypothetical protein
VLTGSLNLSLCCFVSLLTHNKPTEQADAAADFYTCILVVFGSNLGLNIGCLALFFF